MRPFNPNPQSQVYGIAIHGNSLYLGGVFNAIGGVPRSRLAMVDKTTGVLDPTFNPAPDGAVRTFAFSPNGGRIYVGGDFANIAGFAQAYLVALNPITGAWIPVVFQQFEGTDPRPRRRPRRFPRVCRLSVAPRAPATGPSCGNANTGARLWRNESDGDMQAIEYTNGEVYFGFHEGYAGNPLRHLLAADAVTGVIDPNFQPNVNSFWGVWSIDASDGTLAVGGEFTNFDGVAVQGIALLPSLFAGDHTRRRHRPNLLSTGHTSSTANAFMGRRRPTTRHCPGYQIFRDGTQVGFSTSTVLHRQRPQPVDGVQLHGASGRRERQRVRHHAAR